MGLASAGGLGLCPLSSQEMKAFIECSGIDLLPWEFSVIRRMSSEYVAQLNEGEDSECRPPYGDPLNQFDREVVEKKVSSAFKALISARAN